MVDDKADELFKEMGLAPKLEQKKVIGSENKESKTSDRAIEKGPPGWEELNINIS